MRRRFLTFFAVAMALVLPGVGGAESRADYFPLESGMRWAYGDSFHVVEVGGMMKSLPPIYIVDYMGQKRYFIKQDDGKVLEWRDGKKRLLYDFGAQVGASWKIEPLGDGSEILDGTVVTVASVTEGVSTPYGDFKGCVHLSMRPRDGLADAGFTDMWFAPGVGLVKWSEIWIGGVRSYALTGFSVRMETARLKVELTTDRQAYAPGDSVLIRYRLTNVTHEPLKLMFRSGQRYDFILEGARGKVWQWSDGRSFTMALGAQDLAPGDSVVVREAFVAPKGDAEIGESYVLTGFMAVTPDEPGAVAREETVARTKFTVGRSGGDSTAARLTGRVLEDDEMMMRPMVVPIEGARVILTAAGDYSARPVSGVTTWTDRYGQFAFSRMKPDVYVLTVSKPGYVTATMKVDMAKPGEYRVDVSLKREMRQEEAFPNANVWAHERTLAELATDREGYAPGDSVLIRYRLINTSKDTLRLVSGGQRYDFILEGPKGKVWQWSDGRSFTMALGAQDLAPGDSVVVREAFVAPKGDAEIGESYVLTGFMAVTPDEPGAVAREETEARVKFTVGRTGGVRPPEPTIAHPPDYFPLAIGMTWAYGDSFHVVRVAGVMESQPPIYIMDYMGQKRHFIKQDDGKVLEWRDGKKRLLYDFGAKVGATWKIEPLGDGFEILDGTVVTVADTAEVVTTPYGAFKGCVHLGMRPRDGLADAGFTDMWFAPGVGLVKWSEVWIGGVRSFALTRFSTRASEVKDPPDSSSGSQTALIKGDFDRDGRVGFADFFMFADAFGKRSGAPGFEPAFDLDSDGSVGFSDFFLFVDAFGKRSL